MATGEIPKLENTRTMDTVRSLETSAGLRKHCPPRRIKPLPIVSLCDKAAKTADFGFFLIAAHGEVSVEHSGQPCDRNKCGYLAVASCNQHATRLFTEI